MSVTWIQLSYFMLLSRVRMMFTGNVIDMSDIRRVPALSRRAKPWERWAGWCSHTHTNILDLLVNVWALLPLNKSANLQNIWVPLCVCVRTCLYVCMCVYTCIRSQYDHHIGSSIAQLDLNVQYVCLWSILDHASPDVRQVIERNLEAGVFGSTRVSSRWDPGSKSQIWEDDPVDISPSLVGFSLPLGPESGRPSSVILSEEIGFKHLSALW